MNTFFVLLMTTVMIPICIVVFACFVNAAVRMMLPKSSSSILSINNEAVEFQHDHSIATAAIRAAQYCSYRGSSLGFTVENLHECTAPLVAALEHSIHGRVPGNITLVAPVAEHVVTTEASEQTLENAAKNERKVLIVINNLNFEFEYPSPDVMPVEEASRSLADRFCQLHAEEFQLTESSDEQSRLAEIDLKCGSPLTSFLSTSIVEKERLLSAI